MAVETERCLTPVIKTGIDSRQKIYYFSYYSPACTL